VGDTDKCTGLQLCILNSNVTINFIVQAPRLSLPRLSFPYSKDGCSSVFATTKKKSRIFYISLKYWVGLTLHLAMTLPFNFETFIYMSKTGHNLFSIAFFVQFSLGAVKNRKHLLKLERLVPSVLFSPVALTGQLTYSKL
jgi:hypothetical protein